MALVWGQPAILAIVAAILIVAPIPAVASYWALTFAAWAAALWAGDRARTTARKALGAALVVLAVMLGVSNPIAVTIDLALLWAFWRLQTAACGARRRYRPNRYRPTQERPLSRDEFGRAYVRNVGGQRRAIAIRIAGRIGTE